jgi:hypothetical protein
VADVPCGRPRYRSAERDRDADHHRRVGGDVGTELVAEPGVAFRDYGMLARRAVIYGDVIAAGWLTSPTSGGWFSRQKSTTADGKADVAPPGPHAQQRPGTARVLAGSTGRSPRRRLPRVASCDDLVQDVASERK